MSTSNKPAGNPTKGDNLVYIYVIGTRSSHNVKIGYANNPRKRLADLQPGCPEELVVFALYRAPRWLEGKLHDRFAKQRRHGEWFSLAYRLDDIDDAVKDILGLRAWRSGRIIFTDFTRRDGEPLAEKVADWEGWMPSEYPSLAYA